MIAELHFLRPQWILALFPLLGLLLLLWRQPHQSTAWDAICDSHLLKHLTLKKGTGTRKLSLLLLFFSLFFMISALAGPSWYQFPTATYKPVSPRVLVLDMSENMLQTDLTPNRLSRAKFKLQDLFEKKGIGQFGLVAFTGEPFVVSPLTDDGQTIASLLPVLTPDIMPVAGQNLESALKEASNLILSAGYKEGQLLVLTADSPGSAAMQTAEQLSSKGISTSIMPMIASKSLNPLFQEFATAGGGQVLTYTSDSTDLDAWIQSNSTKKTMALSQEDNIPLWRDEGRWFLIPALLVLLPVFRRGWLQKVGL